MIFDDMISLILCYAILEKDMSLRQYDLNDIMFREMK